MSRSRRRASAAAGEQAPAVAVRFAKAAALVGLSRSQWYALAAEGRGPRSFHVGAAHLVSMAALQEWINSQESGGR